MEKKQKLRVHQPMVPNGTRVELQIQLRKRAQDHGRLPEHRVHSTVRNIESAAYQVALQYGYRVVYQGLLTVLEKFRQLQQEEGDEKQDVWRLYRMRYFDDSAGDNLPIATWYNAFWEFASQCTSKSGMIQLLQDVLGCTGDLENDEKTASEAQGESEAKEAPSSVRAMLDRSYRLGGGEGTETCGACKSKNTSAFNIPTNGDEAPIVFYECLNCRKRWRG